LQSPAALAVLPMLVTALASSPPTHTTGVVDVVAPLLHAVPTTATTIIARRSEASVSCAGVTIVALAEALGTTPAELLAFASDFVTAKE